MSRIKPVALVSMPSLSARFPSFQLALLKPTLEKHGIPAQAFSLFMYFGQHAGWRLSETVADVWPNLVGEWIWSKAAFGDEAVQDDEAYFQAYAEMFAMVCSTANCTLDDLKHLRNEVAPRFIDFCIESTDWSRFGLVGFSIVFQQLVSTIAMARALKRRYPDLPIILGGASMEDDIGEELIKGCPWIDFAHCGDGEDSFPTMVKRLYRGESMAGLKGVIWRDGEGHVQFAGRSPNFAAMNETPTPDFDEYFHARKQSGYESYEDAKEVMLPIETARGCWWGMKNHCTFCGLNRSGMEFRAKDVDHALEQLDTLSRRYGQFHFNAIDNIISPEYIEKLFGRLAETNSDMRLHYEIRPNLSRTQLGRMKRGGLFSVQPGVESLSTNILKLMKKFTTGMRNVELIKWCTYYQINNLYNILCRFPGETPEDYRLQSEVIRKIPHLQPPYAIVKARADRGSPMYTDPASQSISSLTPSKCYDYILPPGKFNLTRIAYYFDHQMGRTVKNDEYDEIFGLVHDWQGIWNAEERPFMIYRKAWSTLTIVDGRGPETVTHTYTDGAAALYEYCADARTPRDIENRLGTERWVQNALRDFVSKDLILFLDGRYLSLALPDNPNFTLENAPEPAALIMNTGKPQADAAVQIT